uniref:Urokinase plasminogen activator surface receptor-like n=1 Tax=Pogona vitticeps TaxID=103695 RepID=A0A6J0VD06_9SAUR
MGEWTRSCQTNRFLLERAAFFCLLFASADGLQCYQCVGMFHECVQSEQLCAPKDRSCFSSTIKLFYSNKYSGVFMLPDLEIAQYVMKGCSAERASNRTSNVYSEDDREVHHTYYCDSDLCNTQFTGAPHTNRQEPNGMECYSCFDRGTGDCGQGNATRIKCLGDMNQCMDFTVIDGAWKMTYRTCALETLCQRQYVLPDLSGRLEISCCSTPLCNDGQPGIKSICSHFSEQGTKQKPENSLECASCCDSGQGECDLGNWTHVKCVGEQNMCVNVTEGGQTLLRSCSLEKLCKEKPEGLGLGRNATIQCCSSSLCNRGMLPVGGSLWLYVLLLPAAALRVKWLL